jgi:uncharacterized membrane protein (DUF373 family)
MIKFLNKWLRKIHRWLSIPMIIIVPIAIIIKLTGSDPSIIFPSQLENFQEILLLTLVLSGIYLYFIPYIAKWQRNQRQRAKVKVAVTDSPKPSHTPRRGDA